MGWLSQYFAPRADETPAKCSTVLVGDNEAVEEKIQKAQSELRVIARQHAQKLDELGTVVEELRATFNDVLKRVPE